MEKISSAGLVYLCLAGRLVEDQMEIQKVDTCKEAFCFYEEANVMLETEADVIVFAVIGICDKVEKIADAICQQINDNFNRLLELENDRLEIMIPQMDSLGKEFNQLIQENIFGNDDIKFPRTYTTEGENWKIECFWAEKSPEDEGHMLVTNAVRIWENFEKPVLWGKQLFLQSFLLSDLSGRKIIGVFPDMENGEWKVLMDGGRVLNLGSDISYNREWIGEHNTGLFSVNDINAILNDPVYYYGKFLYPREVYEEWNKVFLYAAGTWKSEWSINEIQKVHEKFLYFVEENICGVVPAEPIIEKNFYYKVMLKQIKELQKYLRGEETEVISKDLWLTLNSRYIYLPYIYKLLKETLKCRSQMKETFHQETMKQLIENSEVTDNYQKGINWEQASRYFIENIEGLEVFGHRIKTKEHEIDLSVINTSLDSWLWEMGAYILAECKNWEEKVGIQVVRGLAHISELKGNRTIFLFASSGITRDAEKEIIRLTTNGKYILFFTKDELKSLKDKEDCYELLIDKWEELKHQSEIYI